MPPPAKRPSRRDLEKRAYRLALGTAGAGLATVIVLLLAIFGAASFGAAFVLALLTAGFGYAFKRTVRR